MIILAMALILFASFLWENERWTGRTTWRTYTGWVALILGGCLGLYSIIQIICYE